MMRLDEKDKKILDLIQKNARLSIRKMAKILNMKPSSVFNRLKKLEKLKVIQGYYGKVNKEALGKGVTAYILISYQKEGSNQEKLANELSKYAEIQEISIITGEWDLIVKIVVKDVKSLGEFVTKILREKKGVWKTNTLVVLKELKNTNYVEV